MNDLRLDPGSVMSFMPSPTRARTAVMMSISTWVSPPKKPWILKAGNPWSRHSPAKSAYFATLSSPPGDFWPGNVLA